MPRGGSRRNQISAKECLKHVLNLSLSQMQRPDFVFVVASMYNRIVSFESGFIQCKTSFKDDPLALGICSLTSEDIADAAKRKDDGLPVGGLAESMPGKDGASVIATVKEGTEVTVGLTFDRVGTDLEEHPTHRLLR